MVSQRGVWVSVNSFAVFEIGLYGDFKNFFRGRMQAAVT